VANNTPLRPELEPDEFCHEQKPDFTAYPLCRWCNERQRADEMRDYCWRRELREAKERIRTLEAEQNDKVRAFNLMLTSLNPMIRRLAERYLDGISNYDEFVKFLQSHPLEAIDAARKGATE